MRSSRYLLALTCLALAGPSAAEGYMFGTLVMQSTDSATYGEVQALTRNSPVVLMPAVYPGDGTLFDRFGTKELDRLGVFREDNPFELEKISLPNPGDTGRVVNDAGRCLTRTAGLEWAQCDGGDRQRWTFRDDALWTRVGNRDFYVGFRPGTPRGGPWALLDGTSGKPTVRILRGTIYHDWEL